MSIEETVAREVIGGMNRFDGLVAASLRWIGSVRCYYHSCYSGNHSYLLNSQLIKKCMIGKSIADELVMGLLWWVAGYLLLSLLLLPLLLCYSFLPFEGRIANCKENNRCE